MSELLMVSAKDDKYYAKAINEAGNVVIFTHEIDEAMRFTEQSFLLAIKKLGADTGLVRAMQIGVGKVAKPKDKKKEISSIDIATDVITTSQQYVLMNSANNTFINVPGKIVNGVNAGVQLAPDIKDATIFYLDELEETVLTLRNDYGFIVDILRYPLSVHGRIQPAINNPGQTFGYAVVIGDENKCFIAMDSKDPDDEYFELLITNNSCDALVFYKKDIAEKHVESLIKAGIPAQLGCLTLRPKVEDSHA